MTIWIDGALRGGSSVPRSSSFAPFETMGALGADVPLWSRHIERLRGAAERLGLAFAPSPALRAAATEVLLKNGHADGVLRLSLVPAEGGVCEVLSSRRRSPVRIVKLLPTVLDRPESAPPGDLKAEPRRYYDLVRQQAQDGDADDGIVVGQDGCLLETAIGNLWVRLAGVWVTPPLDGRVLPGIGRAVLLDALRAASVACAERPLSIADLHAAEAIAHSNAVHGPRPACLVGERAMTALVESELVRPWRRSVPG